MELEVFLGDVELAFAHVAFMLLVRVTNVAPLPSCFDVRSIDTEYLDAIGKKQSIIQQPKLARLNLLNVAVEFVVPLSPVESNAATSGRIKCSHPEVGYSYQLVLVIQELVSASEVKRAGGVLRAL